MQPRNPAFTSIICMMILIGGMRTWLLSQEKSSFDGSEYELSLKELLNTQVTTASKSVEKQSDAPGIISVLTKDELKRFGGTTLRDVLERVPGLISGIGSYTNRSSIIIRGDFIKQNSSHVLILLNGRPVREVQESGLSCDIINTFPVNAIEQIEVIKGPGSVLYGTDAFSGVINIITEKADSNKISLTQFYQAGGGFKSGAEGYVKAGDLNMVVAGQYYEKSVWSAPLHAMTMPINYPPFFRTCDTNINVDVPEKGPGLFMRLNYKNVHFDATYDEWATINFDFLNEVKNTKYFANVGYSPNIRDNWTMDFNVTYAQTKFLGTDFIKRKSYNVVGEWTNILNFNKKTNLSIGGSFSHMAGTETSIWDPENVFITSDSGQSAYTAYAQVDHRLLKFLNVIIGSQLNKVGDLDINYVPRVGMIYYPCDNINVKTLYSEAYRAPSVNELYLNYPGIMAGNKDLRPERVATWDLGIGFQGEKFQAGISAFYSKQKDIIQPVMNGPRSKQYQNLDKAIYKGGEFEAKYYLNKNILLNTSMLYQTNRNGSTYNLVPVANFSAKAGISYQLENRLTASLFDIYQGDIDDKYKTGINPDQGSYNLLHLHSEFALNQLFNGFKKPDISLLFNIDNIFDNKSYMYDWGGVNNRSIPAISGRMIYVGLRMALE